MVAREQRTLEITGTFKDQMSGILAKVRASTSKTLDSFKALARGLSAPFVAPLKALNALANKVLSLRNVFAGFIAFLAVRRTFGFLTETADSLDEIGKTADRINATTESLSALRFAAELSGAKFEDIRTSTVAFTKALEEARAGSEKQRTAFRDLGIDIETLASRGQLDLVDVFGQVADGLGKLQGATEKTNALITLFGESGSKLGPLLATGSAGVQRLADEAAKLGVVFSREQLQRAAAFNASLVRFQTALRGVTQEVFLRAAPTLTGFFESMSKLLAENRNIITQFLADVGRAVVRFADVVSDALIGLIRIAESIPGLFSSTLSAAETRKLADLTATLAAIDRLKREPGTIEIPVVIQQRGGVLGLLFGGDQTASREITLAVDRSILPVEEALRKRAIELGAKVPGGIADGLQARKADLQAQLEKIVGELKTPSAAGGVGQAVGQEIAAGIEEGVASAQESLAKLRADLSTRRETIGVGISVLGLEEDSAAVREQLAALQGELKRLEFGEAFLEGKIGADELRIAIERVDAATAKATARARGDFAQGFADGARRALRAFTDLTQFGAEAAQRLVDQGLNGFVDAVNAFADGTKSAKEAFKAFARETLRLVQQLIIKFAILQAFSFAGLSFAAGGIMPGRMLASESLPVKRYAHGGVAHSPQLAVFGEGRQSEAFVPLPDGRRIPVVMGRESGGGSGLTIIVQTIDGRDTARWFLENRGLLLAIQQNGLSSSTASRQAVQGAAR